jgi:hypothetical protein
MDLLKKIEQAEKELDAAKCRFDYATTNKEIDYAIYLMAIAEENLKNLYKAVRRKGDISA